MLKNSNGLLLIELQKKFYFLLGFSVVIFCKHKASKILWELPSCIP